jgi:hypothetical protein
VALFNRKTRPTDKRALDLQTLVALQRSGAVLTNARNIRHYLYGRDESALTPAVAALRAERYSVQLTPAATGGNWLALAEREEVVDASSVAVGRQLFERLASETLGGEYDGWEAAVVE